MKKILFTIFIFAVAAAALAHEFWLQPQRFIFNTGETASIRFNAGENFTGENWTGNKSRVQTLIHYSPSGKQADVSALISDNKGDSLQLPLQEEGTHMVVFNSVNSFINLEPEKFNEYLKEDGLNNAVKYRKQHNEENINGKEYYQRSVKTLLQVGNIKTNAIIEKTGLPLDIVPTKNVYDAATDKTKMKFTVFFKQEPLPNISVRVWCNYPGQPLVTKELTTNRKGQITADISLPGQWMVSCVHMERNTTDTTADWQSYWGSVTFGY